MYSFTEESQWTRLPQNNGCSLEEEENDIFCIENIYAEGLRLSTEERVQIISVIYQIISHQHLKKVSTKHKGSE